MRNTSNSSLSGKTGGDKPDWAKQEVTYESSSTTDPEEDNVVHSDKAFLNAKPILKPNFGSFAALPLILILLLSAVACGALFVFSVLTLKSDKSECNKSVFSGGPHNPFRFTVQNSTWQCAWKIKNTAIRMIVAALGVFCPILALYAMKKKSKILLWLYTVISFGLAVGSIYVMVIDSSDIKNSLEFCHKSISNYNKNASCAFTPFIIVSLLDAAALVTEVKFLSKLHLVSVEVDEATLKPLY